MRKILESSDLASLILLVALLTMSAFFSSAETALITVNSIKLRGLAEKGNATAKILLKIKDDSDRMISAILIGNNIVNLSASALATTLTIKIFGNKFVGVATGILTILILIFGEITPKTMAAKSAEKIAFLYARPIYFLMFIMTPVIKIVNIASRFFIRILGQNVNEKKDIITEDELRTIVDVSHEEGILENEERKMINNVFDFRELVAKDIMIPRIDMTFVNVNLSYNELLEVIKAELFTRMPVFEENIDNVIGIINVKDLFLIENKEKFNLREHLRPVLFTYESKKITELMLDMRNKFSNIVIVLDEYGATAGMITIEDMIEEIVGEIRDEFDEAEEDEIVKVDKGEYLVDGSMRLDDLNEKIGTDFYSDNFESIGGFIIERLDYIPKVGDSYVQGTTKLIVEKMDKNRIDRVRVKL